MEITITAKVKLEVTPKQVELFRNTLSAYRKGCNFVSKVIFKTKKLSQPSLHKVAYRSLRTTFGLRSQMAQSVVKTVIARYKSAKTNGHDWSLKQFKKPEYDLVWNRDYSLVNGLFSVNTLAGRIKVPFRKDAMEHFFDGIWSFGTAKLVFKHGKFFLHIPMTREITEADLNNIRNVIGIDLGLNFIAVSYDSKGKTSFFKGRYIKTKRAQFAKVRKSLQKKKTSSARKKLKTIGSRENRWMTDVNHQVSKALIEQAGPNSLFVLEDLTGIRSATERVKRKSRYVSVSWAFYQLRTFIEYKAQMNSSKAIFVDPKYTSQACPKCGHIEKANRNKRTHTFCCKTCSYTSNDDRIGAMNLHRMGIEYLVQITTTA